MHDGKVVTRLLSVSPMLYEDIVDDCDDDNYDLTSLDIDSAQQAAASSPIFLEATNFSAESMKTQIERVFKILKIPLV